MKRYFSIELTVVVLLAVCLLVGTAGARANDPAASAEQILKTTGVKGGIVVHLGCGDGKLTAALHAGPAFTVHGLDADAANVAAARKYIQGRGLYGEVSAERFSAAKLPYADNLINLIVTADPGKVAQNEIMRVLAPGGFACIRRNGKWEKIAKAWPDNIDQWTHFLHDASNNAVADDTVVAPPEALQWLAPPPSGIQAPVSSNGRMFYIFDEGLIGITDQRIPDRWSLVCRDAFNGRLLWKRTLESWGWREWSREQYEGKDWTTLRGKRTDVPAENQRRIVADGDRLYTTLSYKAPMSILDAATGKTIATIKATRGANEILVSEGIVVVGHRRCLHQTSIRRKPNVGLSGCRRGQYGKSALEEAGRSDSTAGAGD